MHEYLLTNGLGGYSSSSIREGNTRKYHGLLIVSDAALDRFLCVSKMEEKIIVEDEIFELGTNHYLPNSVHPNGSKYLKSFEQDPCPTWHFELPNGVKISKELIMEDGKNVTRLRYTIDSTQLLSIQWRPLVTYRNIYGMGPQTALSHKKSKNSVVIIPEGGPFKYLIAAEGAKYFEHADWYRNFVYPTDHMQGDFGSEDLFSPGYFEKEMKKGKTVVEFTLSAAKSASACKKLFLGLPAFPKRTKKASNKRSALENLHNTLLEATKDYVIQHDKQTKVLAGYPWFKDWGRDSLISFPGLFLIPKRYAEGKSLLVSFAKKIQHGLLPNRITGLDDYHSIDAPLWFIIACFQYIDASGDKAFAKQIFPSLKKILTSYEKGTDFGIKMDPKDACIAWSDPHENLTWMDAEIDGCPVLDRSGKAVEIQALWYNSLVLVSEIALSLKSSSVAAHWETIALQLKSSFLKTFWNAKEKCLYDSVKRDGHDSSIRPNQLYCVGLPRPLVEGKEAKAIVEICKKELLTPVGLRTLDSKDPLFQNTYRGHVVARDYAYHNGTIWPFLNAVYFHSLLRVEKHSKTTLSAVLKYYDGFKKTLESQCAGHISEIYEEHTLEPRGCFAQAWSVACNLEVVDVLLKNIAK